MSSVDELSRCAPTMTDLAESVYVVRDDVPSLRGPTTTEKVIRTADATKRSLTAQVRADRDTLERRDPSDYFDLGTHVILDGLALKAAARCTRRSGR